MSLSHLRRQLSTVPCLLLLLFPTWLIANPIQDAIWQKFQQSGADKALALYIDPAQPANSIKRHHILLEKIQSAVIHVPVFYVFPHVPEPQANHVLYNQLKINKKNQTNIIRSDEVMALIFGRTNPTSSFVLLDLKQRSHHVYPLTDIENADQLLKYFFDSASHWSFEQTHTILRVPAVEVSGYAAEEEVTEDGWGKEESEKLSPVLPSPAIVSMHDHFFIVHEQTSGKVLRMDYKGNVTKVMDIPHRYHREIHAKYLPEQRAQYEELSYLYHDKYKASKRYEMRGLSIVAQHPNQFAAAVWVVMPNMLPDTSLGFLIKPYIFYLNDQLEVTAYKPIVSGSDMDAKGVSVAGKSPLIVGKNLYMNYFHHPNKDQDTISYAMMRFEADDAGDAFHKPVFVSPWPDCLLKGLREYGQTLSFMRAGSLGSLYMAFQRAPFVRDVHSGQLVRVDEEVVKDDFCPPADKFVELPYQLYHIDLITDHTFEAVYRYHDDFYHVVQHTSGKVMHRQKLTMPYPFCQSVARKGDKLFFVLKKSQEAEDLYLVEAIQVAKRP